MKEGPPPLAKMPFFGTPNAINVREPFCGEGIDAMRKMGPTLPRLGFEMGPLQTVKGCA